jgi:hypothetical protein
MMHRRSTNGRWRGAMAPLLGAVVVVGLGPGLARGHLPEPFVRCEEGKTQSLESNGFVLGCRIEPVGDDDSFEIPSEIGERILLTAANQDAGLDLRLPLEDPAGAPVAEQSCGGALDAASDHCGL